MRIDNQGFSHLLGGASKLREHENARIIGILCGNIFFCNQVHSVLQRSYQPDPRQAVKARQLFAVISARKVADRYPVEIAIIAIDAARQLIELLSQLGVFLDDGAGGRCDLRE